jgi:hypothetical protein
MGAKLCRLRAEQNHPPVQQSPPWVDEGLPQVDEGLSHVEQNLSRNPNVQFRVLIIGRANSGKTSILQRVCDTTESPEIYRPGPEGIRERVGSLFQRHF